MERLGLAEVIRPGKGVPGQARPCGGQGFGKASR